MARAALAGVGCLDAHRAAVRDDRGGEADAAPGASDAGRVGVPTERAVVDVSDPLLQEALEVRDERSDDARAKLLFEATCEKYGVCQGTAPQDCVDAQMREWTLHMESGDDDACLDARLDLFSCEILIGRDEAILCTPYRNLRISRCM